MTPRRLPLRPDTLLAHRAVPFVPETYVSQAGWGQKTFAIATHVTCLGLFGLVVVWPIASPLASGELAREFAPVLELLVAWVR